MKILSRLSLICLTGLLGGCAHTPYKASNQHIQQTQKAIKRDISQYQQTQPAVVVHKGYYVNTTPYSQKRQPKWLRQKITLQAKDLPLGILMSRLLDGSSISVTYDAGVSAQTPITINYSGSVAGALNRLAAITHNQYTIADGTVSWSAFVDKTFDISFMPGASNYMVGQSQSDHTQQNNSNDGQNKNDHLNDMQYSNLQGKLSVWTDLSKTLNDLKSQDGRVIVSESTTSVMVHDHPDNVRAIAQYIARLNHTLSQEVGIRVQVVEVQLNKDYNFGIDWNIVQKILKTQVSLSGDMASATNLVASNLVSDAANTPLGGFQIGKSGSDSSHLLLNALSQEGQVRVVTKPQVVTMNNQIASIRITQDTGYIQSISSSQFDQYQTTTITPGTVTDGFTLYILPKIQKKDVYMQISSRIANLLALQKVSNEPDNESGSSASSKKGSNQFSAIEVPTIASKEFNQRSVVKSGSTLIIAGYKRLSDQTSKAKMFGVSALGGQGSKSQNVETLVLITPVILKSTG